MNIHILHVNQRRSTVLQTRGLFVFLSMMMIFFAEQTKGTIYTIGTGTTSTTTPGVTPFGTGHEDNRIQYLYLASELTATGAAAGNINSIAFNITMLGAPNPENINISIGATSANTISGLSCGLGVHYTAASIAPTAGWNTFYLTTPFYWNGVDNIIVEVCRDNSTNNTNYGVETTSFPTTDMRTFGHFGDQATGCSMTSGGTTWEPYVRPNCQFDIVATTPCNGTPTAGTTVSSSSSVCTGKAYQLSLSGTTNAFGISYQWYESPSGLNSWTPITSATNSTYTNTMTQGGSTDYFCEVACGTSKDSSSIAVVNQTPFYNCYCASAPTYPYDGDIFNVTVGPLNNSSTCTQTGGPGSILNQYSDYTTVLTPDTLYQDAFYPVAVTAGTCSNFTSDTWIKIYLDLDQDGSFASAGEEIYSGTTATTKSPPSGDTAKGIIYISSAAFPLTGLTRMRVVLDYTTDSSTVLPCSNPDYDWGETEDYFVYIPGPAPPCTTATAGTISSNKDSVCTNEFFTLTASGYTNGQSNLMYRWQEESPIGSNSWYDIPGATNPTYIATQTNLTNYRFTVSCGSGVFSSNAVTVSLSSFYVCYCSPKTGTSLHSFPNNDITKVTISSTNLNNSSTISGPGGFTQYYPNVSSQTADIAQTVNYTIQVTTSSTGAELWIDYDKNGTYDPTEYFTLTTSGGIASGTISLPGGLQTGFTGMRVRAHATTYGAGGACLSGNGNETEDYVVNILPTPSCLPPSSVTATNITPSSANIGWTSASSAAQWQIEYGPSPYTMGTGTLITSSTNPYTLTGLIPGTPYAFFVRDICAVNDTSLWTSGSFTTICAPLVSQFPWLYDVETQNNTYNSNIADCWSSAPNNTTNAYRWNTSTGSVGLQTGPSGAYSDSQFYYTHASKGAPGDSAYLITPMIDISSLNQPTLSFYYHMYGSDMGNLIVQIENGAGWISIDSLTGQQQTSKSSPWMKKTISLSGLTGTIKVRFTGIRGSGKNGAISLDDIEVAGMPLAIKLDKIHAANMGSPNSINWNTTVEEDGDRFELQRSADGKSFHTIYERRANGEPSRYTYMDHDPVKGMNYYRLRMTEANGHATFSETVTAFVKSSGFDVQAFPNPVSQELTVKVTGVQGADAAVQVTDVTGKVIRTVKMNGSVEQIDMSGLANGIYLIRYSDASHAQIIKVNKQ